MIVRPLVTTVLAIPAGWLFFSIPLVRYLVWLNAGAISSSFHRPGLFVPLGIFGILAIMAATWTAFWYSYRLWKEIKRV